MPGLVQTGSIDRIEVFNFKSYKGNQVIGPFRNFTAIIGPNGAGKSNLMDAISFVLGVRSVHLRGDKLRDLVYALGDDDSERASRRAHVMLVFVSAGGDELRLTRGITTAGASEYRVNGSTVTWDDYNEKLKSMGILVKARNFLVFQGDVESIASKNPRELTGLFEQISGSEELRKEYERLAEEKARAEESTAFSFQKKKNMAAEKRQRKEQKDEAERHLALQEELREKKAENYLWQLFMNENDTKEAEEAKAEATEQLDKVKEELAELEARGSAQSKENAKRSKDVLSKEKEVAKQEAEIEKKRPEVLKLTGAHKRQQNKLKESNASLEAKKEKRKQQHSEVAQLERQLRVLQEELDQLDTQPGTESQSVRLAADQMEEYKEKKQQVGTKTSKLKQDKEALMRKQQADRDALQQMQDDLQQITEREQQLQQTVEQGQGSGERIARDMEEAQKHLRELQEKHKELQDRNRSTKHRTERLEMELEKAERELRDAKADRRESEQEQRMAEAVGTMKRLFPGVHGRLSDLCKTTQRKYQLAAVVVMGKLFDAVAVEDEATGKECIQYLRDQRLPPMTFIPLASARVKPVQERLRTLGGTSKLLLDILMFNEAIETAVLYAVGNTLVCDSLDEARALAWGRQERNKVVTLDGTLLAKNGCMTGGSSGSIEERARRLQNFDQNVEELKERRDKCLEDMKALRSIHEMQREEQEVASTISGLERRIYYGRMEQKTANDKTKKAMDDLAALQAHRERAAPGVRKLSEGIAKREQEISQNEQRMNEIADRLFAEFCRKVGVANIREYEDEPLKRAQQQAEHRLQLQSHVDKLANQLEYERHRDMDGPIKGLEQAIKEGKNELQVLVQQLHAADKEQQRMQAELETLKQQLAELKSEAQAAEEALQATAKGRSTLNSKLGKAKRVVTAKETVLVQLQARRKELLEACEMEQIQLKTTQGEAVPMDVDSSGAPGEAALALNLDYSSLPRRFQQAMSKEAQEALMEEVRVKMEELSNELERTAPNLKALEQYEAVKEREREVTEEFEAIRQQAKTITDSFLAVKNDRTNRFMKAFGHISNVIDRIYKDLTASRTHPLGGSAYLTLENDEEPFQHGIKFTTMPPTKRWRDMEQLSGGEKTVAALALLFAIHSFRPSPFFVLDEVDAALDNLNVAKVAAYIRSKSRDEAMSNREEDGSEGEEPHMSGFQSVVISLKDQFYDKADALVGVYRDMHDSCSKVLTFDLSAYGS